MALYRAPRVFEQIFNLENYLDVNALQSFIGYAKLSASNVFEKSATFLSEVIVTARLSCTDLNVINTFLGYEVNIFGGIKAPIQSQIDGIIAGGTYTSTISIADTITLPAGEAANVENMGTSTNVYLKFSIPQGIQGDAGNTGSKGDAGNTGPTGQQGPVGSRGEVGYTGPIGATGDTGRIGPIGPTGASGQDGKDGAASSTGATGDTGSTGPTGERGPAGTAASTGATGATGYTGYTGPQGERGDPGEAGGQGPQGEQGDRGSDGKDGKDGSSFEGGFTDFIASAVFTLAVGAAISAAIAAYMGANTLAEALEKAAYATVAYVDGRVKLFTAFGAEYIGTQYCNGSLTIRSILDNVVILNNDGNSVFKNQVDFRNDITVQGDILNKSSDYALDIKATGNDLNLTSTTRAVNLQAGSRIALNAPEVINSGALKVDNIKPIAAQDDLNIAHNNIVCTPTAVLKVNTISEMYDAGGNPSNLTITNPKLVVNNKICCNELTYCNAANSALDISHSVVNILGTLKTDEITSLRDPDNLIDPTQLEIKHEVVKIPESLKVDRISSVTVPPVTNPPTETFMTISHDNVTISNKLKVDKIIPNTVPYPQHPYTELVISHDYVEVSEILHTNSIRSIDTADTISMQGKNVSITAPSKTNVLDPDSEVNITADRSSVRGKTIYIGNVDGSSEIHIIGNCHFYNTQNEQAFWNEVDGFFQQNGI